jgi:hypothetical protein
LNEIFSIRIRRSPANRSCTASTSDPTRVMLDPTARQEIRIRSVTAAFEHAVASHATCSSNANV